METAHTFTANWDGPQTINNKLETETQTTQDTTQTSNRIN